MSEEPLEQPGDEFGIEMSSDWRDEEIASSPGILAKTLRNVGLLVVVCAGIAIAAGSLGDKVSESARERGGESDGAQTSASPSIPANAREHQITANAAGYFVLDGEIGSSKVHFLMDVGQARTLLSRDDARRAGINIADLGYSERVETKGVVVQAATVSLQRLRVGTIILYNVEALVNSAPMRVSILGKDFLAHLKGWQIRDNQLTLAY